MDATKKRNLILILLLGALSAVSPFAIDMYLAAFPQIAESMETTPARVSLSLSSYFIGLAAGQLFYGPLLDRFGRTRPLYAGLGVFFAASLGCVMAQSVEILIVLRFVQALGGCVAGVASLAMVRDFFRPEESARVLSLMMLVLGTSPFLAPTIGSLVAVHFGWQWIFILLAVLVFGIVLSTALFLPQGYTPDKTVSLKPLPILKTFRGIFVQRQFFVYTFAGGLSFAGLFTYVAGSPIIFMDVFGVSPRIYGLIFAGLATGFIGGNQVNVLLSKFFAPGAIFRGALSAQAAISVVFVGGAYMGLFGLYGTVVIMFFILACLGMVYPNAAALALAPFEKNAGSASALLGFLQMSIGSIASAGVGFFNMQALFPIICTLGVGSLSALAVYLIWHRGLAEIEARDTKAADELALKEF